MEYIRQLSLFDHPDPVLNLCMEALPQLDWRKEEWNYISETKTVYVSRTKKRNIHVSIGTWSYKVGQFYSIGAEKNEGDFHGCEAGFEFKDRDKAIEYMRVHCMQIMEEPKGDPDRADYLEE